jgi:uncharacterized membrane protein YidH (DUF202 family)
MKVEPKVFFANERTFLSWLNSALFMSSVGLALATADGATSGRFVGGVLVSVGMLLIIYACLTYIQRNTSLMEKKAAGYHDEYGPVALAAIIIIMFITAFFMG